MIGAEVEQTLEVGTVAHVSVVFAPLLQHAQHVTDKAIALLDRTEYPSVEDRSLPESPEDIS